MLNFISRSRRPLTTNDIIYLLENITDDDEIQGANVFIDPPGDDRVSDGDSGEEEDAYFHNLSCRQLLAPATLTLRRPFTKETIASEDEEPDDIHRRWNKIVAEVYTEEHEEEGEGNNLKEEVEQRLVMLLEVRPRNLMILHHQ